MLPSTSFKILVQELKVRGKSLQCDPGLSMTRLLILQAILSDPAAKYRPWQIPEKQITAKSKRSMTGIHPLPEAREAPTALLTLGKALSTEIIVLLRDSCTVKDFGYISSITSSSLPSMISPNVAMPAVASGSCSISLSDRKISHSKVPHDVVLSQ